MPPKTITSAKDYLIESAVITADRSEGSEIDITAIIIQLNIFENIERAYLTGSVTVKDDLDLINQIDITGTERLELVISIPTNPVSLTINFIIEGIESAIKYGDQPEMVTFKLIQQVAFDSSTRKFSKAYSGKPEEIIASILKDNLNLDLINLSIPSAQAEMKVIIPYMTPLQACDWILSRMTTEYGAPYFLYSAINEKSLVLKDLQTILIENAWNYSGGKGLPFSYNQAQAQYTDNSDIRQQSFVIENVKYTNTENTSKLVKMGAMGANYSWSDVTSGITESRHFSLKEALGQIESIVLKGNKKLTIDAEYIMNNVKIDQLNSSYVHQVLSRNTYLDYNNYFEENDITKYMLTATARAMKILLFKSNIQITVPGIQFIFGENRSIGTNNNLLIYNSNVTLQGYPGVDAEILKDKKRSGDYLVHSTLHMFTLGKHSAVIYGVKLTDQKA